MTKTLQAFIFVILLHSRSAQAQRTINTDNLPGTWQKLPWPDPFIEFDRTFIFSKNHSVKFYFPLTEGDTLTRQWRWHYVTGTKHLVLKMEGQEKKYFIDYDIIELDTASMILQNTTNLTDKGKFYFPREEYIRLK